MRKFTDCLGRTWEIDINVATMRQLRKDTGVDLFLIYALSGLAKHFEDVEQVVNVLWSFCQHQAKALGINEDAFAAGFMGDVLIDGADAVIESWIDYQGEATHRDALREAYNKVRQARAALVKHEMDLVMQKLDAIDCQQIADDIFPKLHQAS